MTLAKKRPRSFRKRKARGRFSQFILGYLDCIGSLTVYRSPGEQQSTG